MIIQNNNAAIISKIKERYSHIDINVFIDFTLAKKYDKNDITTYKHCIPYYYYYINNKTPIEFSEFSEQIMNAVENTNHYKNRILWM